MLALWFACSTPAEVPAPAPPAAPATRTRRAPADGEQRPPSPDGAPRVDKRLRRDYPTPAHAESFLDEVVVRLLEDPILAVDPAEVERACTADGRHCSFEGPWREEFVGAWIQMVAREATSVDALEGVTVTAFRPRDALGGRRFVLEAHAP